MRDGGGTKQGRKAVLGFWIEPSEGASKWREHLEAILSDFSAVYGKATLGEAREALSAFVAKWSATYPSFRKYLTEDGLFAFLSFPPAIRKAIYASNAIESLNSKAKRDLRRRISLNSLANATAVLVSCFESYNRSGRNRRVAGYYEMPPDELASLGDGKVIGRC